MEAVTVGYVAASFPSLATPSLADAADDAVDGESIRFLVWGALKTPEQVEAAKQASLRRQKKAAAKKEKEMAEKDVEASSSQRRRKKRKKLPKSRGPLLPQVHRQGRLRRGAEAHPHSLSFPAVACAWLVLLVFYFSCAPFCCRQARMLDIVAGMGQKDSYAARCWPRSCLRKASIVFLCRGGLGCCCSRARVRGFSLGSDWWR